MKTHTEDLGSASQCSSEAVQSTAAAARIQPSTVLPWRVESAGNYSEVYVNHANKKDGWGVCRVDGRLENRVFDGAYIVHACNAYPKLVDALIEARLQLLYMQSRGEGTSTGETVISRTEGILRELGEL